jgi:hypothetical protein
MTTFMVLSPEGPECKGRTKETREAKREAGIVPVNRLTQRTVGLTVRSPVLDSLGGEVYRVRVRLRGFSCVGLLGLPALLLGCSFFSPNVGPECAVSDASLDAGMAQSTSYGSYTSAPAPAYSSDAGCLVDAPGNVVATHAGLEDANVLVADQLNNRVIELTRAGEIVWSFGNGSNVPSPASIVGPNDSERLPSGETLIAGTGGPPGCGKPGQGLDAGCPDNRVLIVSAGGQIVWQYGASDGTAGADAGLLDVPATARLVGTSKGDHVLIADQGNQRVIEVDRATQAIVWRFPPAADASASQALAGPNSAERLPNGNTLITDQLGNRVLVVTPSGQITWEYQSALSSPSFASRLPSCPPGDASPPCTLIANANDDQVLIVDSPGSVVWSYTTTSFPTHAVQLSNGHTLIAVSGSDDVIELDGAMRVVYSHGRQGVPGGGGSLLNQPYDAKIIGDYTGLSSPVALAL